MESGCVFCPGSINKKKEQKKKKGLSYEELRLPAITAFSSGGTQTEPIQNSIEKMFDLNSSWLTPSLSVDWQLLLVSQTGTALSHVIVVA